MDAESLKPALGGEPGDAGAKEGGPVPGAEPEPAAVHRNHLLRDNRLVSMERSNWKQRAWAATQADCDEVISHLSGLIGAKVTVTLEIEAEVPSGAPDNVVRTVTENSRTLKFTSQGFEKE